MDDQLLAHQPFADSIAEQFAAAQVVLVLGSDDAVQSERVRPEANRGREAGTLPSITPRDPLVQCLGPLQALLLAVGDEAGFEPASDMPLRHEKAPGDSFSGAAGHFCYGFGALPGGDHKRAAHHADILAAHAAALELAQDQGAVLLAEPRFAFQRRIGMEHVPLEATAAEDVGPQRAELSSPAAFAAFCSSGAPESGKTWQK